jgi:hypothetical protein
MLSSSKNVVGFKRNPLNHPNKPNHIKTKISLKLNTAIPRKNNQFLRQNLDRS